MPGARVIVCNTSPASSEIGGSEMFAAALTEKLNEAGHQATLVTFPWSAQFQKKSLMKGCRHWADLDLTNSADVVIPLRFPTWLVKHPNKVVYLNHQLRVAYDLFGKPHGPSIKDSTQEARQFVLEMDAEMARAKKIFAVSRNVQQRLKTNNGLDSEVLYHGLPHEGMHRTGDYGDFILSVGRLISMKRVDLLIRAMARTKTPVRCLITGEGKERPALEQMVRKFKVGDKVQLLGRVGAQELMNLYAGALGVFYAPVDEDYGLVTLEAFRSEKPVFTAIDSGGVLEFVRDKFNGRVLPPESDAFAEAIDHLYRDRWWARKMGAAGAQTVRHITWGNCIHRLAAYF